MTETRCVCPEPGGGDCAWCRDFNAGFDRDLDKDLEETLAMTPEQITLSLARSGISPCDLDASWEKCRKMFIETTGEDPGPRRP